MIAAYHGVSNTQTYIAGRMDTDSTGTSITGMLNYYRNDLGYSNSNIYSVIWLDMVDMIDAGLPFANLMYYPGKHVRTGAGYWVWSYNNLYILDPYPVNQGDTYWEATDFWFLPSYKNIYVQ